jgi:hypothetical protein
MKLKTLSLAVALTAAAFTSQVQANSVELCTQLSEAAKAVMGARQSGVEMSVAINLADNAGEFKPVLTAMVIAAYDVHGYSGEDARQREVVKFANLVFKECYK